MRHKLLKKQFAAIALIVFLSILSILIILTFIYNAYIADEKYKTLQTSCDTICDFVEKLSTNQININNEYGVYYVMSNLARVSECDILVTDQNGVIQVCSCKDWETENNCEHSGSQIKVETLDSIVQNKSNTLSTLDYYSRPHYTVVNKIELNDVTLGYVVAAASADEARDFMIRIVRIYVISAIIPLIVMFAALSVITYRLTKPLKLMSDAAKAMARGDFSRRIPVTSDDEIGQLAVSFNQMTNSLARLEEVRKSFIANVSHELKTPMTTISGFIDGIIDGTIDGEKQPYYLGIVHEEVKRLSRMVEAMLNVSRLESEEFELKRESFNFKDQLLSIVISQEQRIEKKKIDIVGLDSIADVSINADKDLMHRVVYNLVDNAIKFTNEGGKISFKVNYNSKNFTFRIENTGKGIPQGELPYVFERFYKVDKSRSSNKDSTGLGLYIVKTIIKKHGGAILVSSIQNKFTAFEFTLPVN